MSDFRARHRLPRLGVGIGLRRSLERETVATPRHLDWLEVIPENFLGLGGRSARMLDAAQARWPLLPHGIGLDIGGPDPLDDGYLEALGALAARLDAPWFSDHLCFTRIDGFDSQDLLPLPFTHEAVEHVCERIAKVKQVIPRPLLLENASYYVRMPGSELSELEFLLAVAERADIGLLLDLNNVVVNCLNHGGDPRAFVDAIPPGRVVQFHLAGHTPTPELVIDTHIGPIPESVWALYRHALARFGPVTTLVEWDSEIPSLDAYVDEADRARALMQEVCGIEASRPGLRFGEAA